MRISGWSSDVFSSDLCPIPSRVRHAERVVQVRERRQPAPQRRDAVAGRLRLEVGNHGRRRRRKGHVGFFGAPAREAEPVGAKGLPGLERVSHAQPGEVVCDGALRSEEHTSELQSLMRISYAVFCLQKKNTNTTTHATTTYKQTQSTQLNQ